jgi:hypothetical protein
MGKHARAMKAAFFKENPYCIFCGGATPATTKEHCPPSALFQNRHAPEGYVFPACEACNGGTSDDDALIAMLGRMNPFSTENNLDGKVPGLMMNANRQHPGLVRDMLDLSPIQARKAAKDLNIPRPPGLTYQQSGIVNVTDHMDHSVRVFAKKLSKAMYFKETGKIFPNNGEIQLRWFTNVDLFRHGTFPTLDAFAEIAADKPKIERNRQDLSNQFDYRFSVSTDGKLAVLRALFGKAFGLVTILSPIAGTLTDMDRNLCAQTRRESGPFEFI